jgi:AraC-like DNA-binding protein
MILDLSVEKGPIEIFQDLPDALEPFRIPHAVTLGVKMDFGHALFHEFKGGGFSVWYNQYSMSAPGVMLARGHQPLLEFRCALGHPLQGYWEGVSNPGLGPNCFSIDTTPHVNTRAVFEGQKEYAMFDIQFERAFFENNRLECKELDGFLKTMDQGNPKAFAHVNLPCPPIMRRSIREILDNPYCLSFQSWVLEANVKTILIAALHTARMASGPLSLALTPHQTKALHTVRNLIETNIMDPIPNEALCRKVKITEEVLLVGFRLLFDTTPYEYHMHVKFLEAERLLNKGDESIVDVAYLLGYRHAGTFCAEFKRRFGYTAGDYKASRKKLGNK